MNASSHTPVPTTIIDDWMIHLHASDLRLALFFLRNEFTGVNGLLERDRSLLADGIDLMLETAQTALRNAVKTGMVLELHRGPDVLYVLNLDWDYTRGPRHPRPHKHLHR